MLILEPAERQSSEELGAIPENPRAGVGWPLGVLMNQSGSGASGDVCPDLCVRERPPQALADPDWFRKVVTGHGSQVRLCLYTNYCEALDQRHRQVTCELWDREGLDDPGVKRSADGKRRLTPPPWQP